MEHAWRYATDYRDEEEEGREGSQRGERSSLPELCFPFICEFLFQNNTPRKMSHQQPLQEKRSL